MHNNNAVRGEHPEQNCWKAEARGIIDGRMRFSHTIISTLLLIKYTNDYTKISHFSLSFTLTQLPYFYNYNTNYNLYIGKT